MTWLALEQTFLWFLLYSFVGWLWETVLNIVMKKRFVDRGILNGPICPIYGFGALLAIYALPGEHSVVAIFLSSGVLCCTLEYFTSWAIEKLFHMRLWDYSGKPFNINGRVYLNGFLFFAAGCTVVKLWVQPHVMDLLDAIDPRTITVLAVALLVALLADAAVTLAGLTSLNSRLGHAEQDIKALKARGIAHIDVGITAADKRIESTETRITTVCAQLTERAHTDGEALAAHVAHLFDWQQRRAPVRAAQPGEFQRQHRSDTLTARQHAVSHGLIQPPVGGAAGEQPVQILLHRQPVLLILSFVLHAHSSAKKSLSTGAPSAPLDSLTTFCSALSSSLRHWFTSFVPSSNSAMLSPSVASPFSSMVTIASSRAIFSSNVFFAAIVLLLHFTNDAALRQPQPQPLPALHLPGAAHHRTV